MNEKEIKFRLSKITTGQFATIDSVEINEQSINLSFGFSFGINEGLRIVGCNAKFQLLSNDSPFIILNVICDFEVSEESWKDLLNDEKKTITLPSSLAAHLAAVTVGTARGVLHCKTENTKFNKYFLPTINVTDSIKSDLDFSLVK